MPTIEERHEQRMIASNNSRLRATADIDAYNKSHDKKRILNYIKSIYLMQTSLTPSSFVIFMTRMLNEICRTPEYRGCVYATYLFSRNIREIMRYYEYLFDPSSYNFWNLVLWNNDTYEDEDEKYYQDIIETETVTYE
jgi:hypothetical protein